MAAQLSTQFSAALALATGGSMPEDVEKGLNDPEIMDLARCLSVVIDDSLPLTARDITFKANMIFGGEKKVSIELPLGEPERAILQNCSRIHFYT